MFRCEKHGGGRNFFGFNCAGFGAIMPLTELPGEKWRSCTP
ncbi:MAG TPA: hypothetical protein VHI99_13335 [Vicinamibacterales bacterium]|jgi:hypothetical protein|nr:hypothetical protein [Vicinamibacterales bacterium]